MFINMLSVSIANAAFVDQQDYLTDTTSGLDWLDVTKTKGQNNYGTITDSLQPSQSYAGWRFATSEEFKGLIANWTGSTVFPLQLSNSVLDDLATKLGFTQLDSVTAGSTSGITAGYLFTPDGATAYNIGDIIINQGTASATGGITTPAPGGVLTVAELVDVARIRLRDKNAVFGASEFYGAYLVRQSENTQGTIPEPTSLALMGLGFAGMYQFRRRKAPV